MTKCTNKELGQLLIEYEAGILSEEQCDRFEEHVMECDFCRRELETLQPFWLGIHRNKAAIIEILGKEGISYESLKRKLSPPQPQRSSLKAFLARATDRFSRAFRTSWAWGTVAIATIGIVLLSWVYPYMHRVVLNPYIAHLSFEKLSYQPMELRGEVSLEAKRVFEEGMSYYSVDDYSNAISRLRKAVKGAPDRVDWWLYLGVSYYLNRQPKRAIQALAKADSPTYATLQERARWYLAQAYLLRRDPQKADPLLEWIVAQDRMYASQADSLLRFLNGIGK